MRRCLPPPDIRHLGSLDKQVVSWLQPITGHGTFPSIMGNYLTHPSMCEVGNRNKHGAKREMHWVKKMAAPLTATLALAQTPGPQTCRRHNSKERSESAVSPTQGVCLLPDAGWGATGYKQFCGEKLWTHLELSSSLTLMRWAWDNAAGTVTSRNQVGWLVGCCCCCWCRSEVRCREDGFFFNTPTERRCVLNTSTGVWLRPRPPRAGDFYLAN